MGEKQKLMQRELRDNTRSLGELRTSLNAMWQQMVRQQEMINDLRQQLELLKAERFVGGIEGLEGQVTVMLPPEWYV